MQPHCSVFLLAAVLSVVFSWCCYLCCLFLLYCESPCLQVHLWLFCSASSRCSLCLPPLLANCFLPVSSLQFSSSRCAAAMIAAFLEGLLAKSPACRCLFFLAGSRSASFSFSLLLSAFLFACLPFVLFLRVFSVSCLCGGCYAIFFFVCCLLKCCLLYVFFSFFSFVRCYCSSLLLFISFSFILPSASLTTLHYPSSFYNFSCVSFFLPRISFALACVFCPSLASFCALTCLSAFGCCLLSNCSSLLLLVFSSYLKLPKMAVDVR